MPLNKEEEPIIFYIASAPHKITESFAKILTLFYIWFTVHT